MKRTKHVFFAALMLAAFSVGSWAQTQPASPASQGKNNPATAQPAVTAADIQALKDALAAQQQQIQHLTEQLQKQSQQNSQQARQGQPMGQQEGEVAGVKPV
ncbi:MAG: hypothetical protein WBX08_16565, partial [Candidatus Sulfotelmatobacter sp.]